MTTTQPKTSSARGMTRRDRQLARTFAALRLGATTFGVLVGVATYVLLDQFTAIGIIPSFVVGLCFALTTRTAAASLAREWLLSVSNRASGNSPSTHPNKDATER